VSSGHPGEEEPKGVACVEEGPVGEGGLGMMPEVWSCVRAVCEDGGELWEAAAAGCWLRRQQTSFSIG
jgi:hypothetical protein